MGSFHDHRTEDFPYIIPYNKISGKIGMDPIGLVQRIDSSHTLQEKRNKLDVFLLGNIFKNGVVSCHVFWAHTRRHHHSSQNHFHGWFTRTHPFDDFQQVRLRLLGWKTTPSSRTKISTSQLSSTQSRRLRPVAVVSPLTPAFTT